VNKFHIRVNKQDWNLFKIHQKKKTRQTISCPVYQAVKRTFVDTDYIVEGVSCTQLIYRKKSKSSAWSIELPKNIRNFICRVDNSNEEGDKVINKYPKFTIELN